VAHPSWQVIVKCLLGMQVYLSQGVSVSWKFRTPWGKEVSGRAEKGRVMLAPEAGALKIYLISEDMEIGCPPLELTDELAAFCGIKNVEHLRLLNYILVQKDTRRIEQEMNRRDVPDNVSENRKMDPSIDTSRSPNFNLMASELKSGISH